MDPAAHWFSQSYAEARGKFLAAADAAGLDVHSHAHPMLGRDGEALAMDVARYGPADANGLLILSSACHGVEGFCGSAIQTALLSEPALHSAAHEAGVAVLYVHALNPYGFSWWRRTTHENVDLNRNFHDFSQPLPANPGYDELAHALVPQQWPPTPQNEAVLMAYAEQHGAKGLQQAITAGQYSHPQGIFYGGINPTWSQQTLRHVLQEHGRRCARLGWVDFHTGLGPSGVGERILACRNDPEALARARRWWGPQVTSIYEGSSSAVLLEGLMWLAAYDECPQAQYTGVALEFGTVPLEETLYALRADQWLDNHPEAGAPQAAQIKRLIRDAFYADTPAWKDAVIAQGREVALQAVRGLMS
ncbi:MAG: M14 family metallopeptidase [Pseudomonadota bacterium]